MLNHYICHALGFGTSLFGARLKGNTV